MRTNNQLTTATEIAG